MGRSRSRIGHSYISFELAYHLHTLAINRSTIHIASSCIGLRTLTHAPETGSRNRCHWHQIPALVFRADARLLTSLTAFGARRQSMTLEVVHRHEKLAPESGVKFMAPISGAGFWSVCQRPERLRLIGWSGSTVCDDDRLLTSMTHLVIFIRIRPIYERRICGVVMTTCAAAMCAFIMEEVSHVRIICRRKRLYRP